jgi:hypothetical protein
MVQPWFLFGDLVCIPSLRGCPDKKANRVCCDSGRPSCTVHRRSSCASYIPGPRKWRQCKRWTKNDKGSLVVYKQSRQTKTRALTSPSWWNYSQLTRVVEPCWTPLSHQRNVKTWKWTSYFIRIHSWSSAPDSCFTRFLGTKNASITQPKELIPLNIYIYICVCIHLYIYNDVCMYVCMYIYIIYIHAILWIVGIKPSSFDELCGSLLGTRGYENLSPHIWLMFKCIDFPMFGLFQIRSALFSSMACSLKPYIFLLLFQGRFFQIWHAL